MKIILVDPNLVRTFFGNNFFDPSYRKSPWKLFFKGYLRYFSLTWIRLNLEQVVSLRTASSKLSRNITAYEYFVFKTSAFKGTVMHIT